MEVPDAYGEAVVLVTTWLVGWGGGGARGVPFVCTHKLHFVYVQLESVAEKAPALTAPQAARVWIERNLTITSCSFAFRNSSHSDSSTVGVDREKCL